jgi:hypothetical protein
MQFTIAAIISMAAVAFAAPLEVQERQVGLCSSGNPVCCATDVLNLADLNCNPRTFFLPYISSNSTLTFAATTTPANVDAFIASCAAEGQQAKCCLAPILGQALFCSNVNPTAAAPAAASA